MALDTTGESRHGGYMRVLVINTAGSGTTALLVTDTDTITVRAIERMERYLRLDRDTEHWKREMADMARLMKQRAARERCPPTPVHAWHRRRPQDYAAVHHKVLLRPPRCACPRYLSLNEKRMAWGFR